MKVWITKYALTSGIFEINAEVDGAMCSYRRSPEHFQEYAHRDEFHLNEDSAKKKAEDMRIKKLQSLDKQIKKISKLVF